VISCRSVFNLEAVSHTLFSNLAILVFTGLGVEKILNKSIWLNDTPFVPDPLTNMISLSPTLQPYLHRLAMVRNC